MGEDGKHRHSRWALMPHDGIPLWATTLAAGAMPLMCIGIAQGLARPGSAHRSYGVLVALALLLWLPVPHVAGFIHHFIEPIHDPTLHAIARGFLPNLSDQIFQFLPFYIWLAAFRRPTPQDCICGAVLSSLVINMAADFSLFLALSADYDKWFGAVIARSFFVMPSVFISAMTVGLWTAVLISDKRAEIWQILAVLTVVFVADGLWMTAGQLGKAQAPLFVWLLCFVISASLRIGMIKYALRALARRNVYLRFARRRDN